MTMAGPSKNPLLGSFRAPPTEDSPPAAPITPPKPTEEKKPAEIPKADTPAKGDTPTQEDKGMDGKAPVTPGKSGEGKKPTEPPKVPEGEKPDVKGEAAKGDKAPATPGKPGEEKKPTEPPKAPEGKKPDDKGGEAKGDKAPAAPGKAEEKKPADKGREAQISISEIEPDDTFAIDENDSAFKQLMADISKNGLKEPIAVIKEADGKYKIIDGNRRLVAMKKLGAKKINALVTDPPKVFAEEQTEKLAEELDKDGIPKDFSMVIVPKDKLGQVTMMAMTYIDEFEGHPFPVRDDADMAALVDSIKQVGILEPATIIRNPKKPGRFEMVAGHRRMHGAKLAGLTEIPVIVRDMDHDEATVYMVDSNLKREIPLTPMEKARAYTMRAEALKRKTGRRSKAEIAAMEASGKKPMTADEQIAEQTGESVAQVQRLKTLTKLEKPLQEMVDKKQLPVNTAVDIAQMKPEEQKKLADAIEKEGGTVPSGAKAKELKEESRAGTLTAEKIEAAVAPTKREIEPPLKVTLLEEDLKPYISKGTTVPDIKKAIFEGLELRKKLIERKKAKEQEEKEGKKKPPAPVR